MTPSEVKAMAKERAGRLAAELAVTPGPLQLAAAIFQGLHGLGRIGGDRPTPVRGRVTVIDTTAIEVETRRAR